MSRPSNGTMGHMWLERWCFRCIHDHGFSHVSENDADPAQGCELTAWLMMSSADESRPEFIEHDYDWKQGWSPDHYECRLFERCPCEDDPGWEPPIKPMPIPGQELLFEVVDETPFTPMMVVPRDDLATEKATT